MGRLAPLFALVLMAGAGCVTTQEEGSGPEACVVVDNTEGAGAQSRLFLVSESSGWRLGMGQVGM